MGPRRAGIAVLALVLASAACAEARAARRLALHYDAYYLAMPILSLDVVSEVEPETYHTTVDLRTAGVLHAFVRWQSRAVTHGRVDGRTLRPIAYRAQSDYRKRRQLIDLTYGHGGRVQSDVVGILTDGEREAVPEALRDGTVDPITASAVLAQWLASTGSCTGTVPIFDGLRRYDLRYEDLGPAELPRSGRDPYYGPARLCRATVHSIAGFLRTGDRAGERATEVSTWLAPPLPGAAPVAVRIVVRGTRGTLNVHLARASEADQS